MNRAIYPAVLLPLVILSVIAGCGAPPNQQGGQPKNPNPPTPPPPAPTRVEKPIDQDLRVRAQGELSKAFASTNPIVRANAVEATQRGLGIVGGERIMLALEDQSPLVQFAGAMAAGTVQLSDARPKLNAMLKTPGQLTAEFQAYAATLPLDQQAKAAIARGDAAATQIGIRYALHKLGDKTHSHDLEIFAQDADPSVRANVVLILGLLEEKSAMTILKQMQRDGKAIVRLQVVEARYRLGDESALEELVVGTVSTAPDDQIISLLALGARRDERVAGVVRSKLTSDYPEVSLAAARAMGMIGNDSGMGVALKSVGADEPRQRAMAAMALGEIGRTDGQSSLAKLLRDSDPSVRLAAATAVLQLRSK